MVRGHVEKAESITGVNAHTKSYGDGWECDWGYRPAAQSCEPITVPAHAHLDAFGGRWDCDRGYLKVNEACASVQVPLHAFLNSSGHDWRCDRGYQRNVESCVAVMVPADAYLDSSGDRGGVRARISKEREVVRGARRPDERAYRLLGQRMDV